MATKTRFMVGYGQYVLREQSAPLPDVVAVSAVFATNTLVTTGDGWVLVIPGTEIGPLAVTLSLVDAAPPLALDGWEAVVDISYRSVDGETFLRDSDGFALESAGSIAHDGPGWYRLRVAARDRERFSRRAIDPGEVEEHHITAWPAAQAPEQVHLMDRLYVGSPR